MMSKDIKMLLREQYPFLLPYVLFLSGGLFYFFLYYKGEMNLYFNCHRTITGNIVFSFSTRLAEAWVSTFVFIVLLMYRYTYALLYALNSLVLGIVLIFLKVYVFNIDRPVVYFSEYIQLDPVPGVELLKHYSFPSGHTAFAFASFFMLSLLFKSKSARFVFFCMALAVGISRIYLQQHFFEDVYAGSITGMICSFTTYLLITRTNFFKKNTGLLSLITSKNNND